MRTRWSLERDKVMHPTTQYPYRESQCNSEHTGYRVQLGGALHVKFELNMTGCCTTVVQNPHFVDITVRLDTIKCECPSYHLL